MPTPEPQPQPERGDTSSCAPDSPSPDPTTPTPAESPPSPAELRGRAAGGREGGASETVDGDPVGPAFIPIDTSRGRFKRNVLANIAYFVFNAGIQLWFVRYLIDNLGVATYGLVPLATNITNYMAIITVALSGSVGRFLTIDLARGDLATANRTFNTSLFASIVLAFALLPVAGALSWFAPALLDIPEGEEMGTRFLLMCTCFAFLLNAVGSNFACSTFAKNRFDVQRVIDALGFITQVGVVVALFTWAEGDLWYVGAGIAASAVVRQIGYQVAWRMLTPELSIRLGSFDRTRLREILGMGGWLTVNQVGGVLLVGSDLVLVNALVGAHAAGLYAPCLQIAAVVRAVATLFSSALAPTMAASFAVDDTDRMARISRRSTKTLGLAVAVPVGLVCGLAEPLLVLWLGDEFRPAAYVLMLVVAGLAVHVPVTPLFGIMIATNRIVWPAVATVATGVTNIGLALLLAGPAGWGMYGVAIAGMVAFVAKDAFFSPMYSACILRRPLGTFVAPVMPGVAVAALIGAAAWLISGRGL